jgi:hypothetical protein
VKSSSAKGTGQQNKKRQEIGAGHCQVPFANALAAIGTPSPEAHKMAHLSMEHFMVASWRFKFRDPSENMLLSLPTC